MLGDRTPLDEPTGTALVRRNAVFEGGGVKGIALVGALTRILEKGVSFDAVAGSSAGAIVAALYAAGYTAADLKIALLETAFSSLLDPRWSKTLGLFTRYGQYQGDKIYQWVHRLLRLRVPVEGPDPTVRFKHLPKDLVVIASDLTFRKPVYFSRDSHAPHIPFPTPNADVAEAVRMSISIRLFFEPYKLGRSLIVDGGLLSNYPIHVFDDSQLPTIGFRLVAPQDNAPPERPNSFPSFLRSIIATLLQAADKEDRRHRAWASTIHIPTGSITATTFELTTEQQDILFKDGYIAATRFLDGEGAKFLRVPTPASQAEGTALQQAAWNEIQAAFDQLPRVLPNELPWVAGAPVTREVRTALEKADNDLVKADILKVPADAEKKARYFIDAAEYWAAIGEDDRAIDRLHRATTVGKTPPEVWQRAGRTLSFVAAKMATSQRKTELLEEAEQAINQAIRLRERPTPSMLHDLAWNHDERGQLSEAADYYRQALAADPDEEWKQWITYNLACTLAKAGRLKEAFEYLASCLIDGEWARIAARDADLNALRASPEYGEKLKKLLESALKLPSRRKPRP